ncbi:MAG: endo-1,4-beta-xylanase [Acidobacteria bacterium]|nr:endo-1,4-beta-xylanase [Acidobacteriota bacterium]
MLRLLFTVVVCGAGFAATPVPLTSGDPTACFNRMDGAGTLTTVAVSGMPFSTALHVKTAAIPATANDWDIRPRCFATLAAKQDDVVVAAFWMRAVAPAGGMGFTTFVVEQNVSPYTKSVTYTAAAGSQWRRFEAPFTMAQTYAAGGYNLSFWTTFPNQEIEIGGFTILDYGPGVPFSALGLTAWPYDGHAADAPWRTAAAQRIDRYRKGDIVVALRDDAGKPMAGTGVRVKMRRHGFGFGTAVAGDALQNTGADGANYRAALKRLFNKAVPENALKWPFFESWGRPQADYMLPWLASNGFAQVRGHNVIWPGLSNLPQDVQTLLKTAPVDATALRKRIDTHIAEVMAYARGKVTEWDVLNEPYTNKDVQAALGDAEMISWFQQARAADPGAKLYINDYDNVESGGYSMQHINGFYSIIKTMLEGGAPIDGIGLQAHFNTNLTAPDRVMEVFDQFAGFGKDLQITEFDVTLADEQLQADYTRDFLTLAFSHPAVKGFMIWGFWAGAHWRPSAAMIRKDWSTTLAHDAWNDLIYRQWWTDVTGTTGVDGTFRTRGFLGDYDVEYTVNGVTRTLPLTTSSNTLPTYVSNGSVAGTLTAAGVVNGASFQGGSVAPGEIVTIFGSGFGPASIAQASYGADRKLPTSVGDTKVLFDGIAAPMIYAAAGQTAAIAPYAIKTTTKIQVEYLGTVSNAVALPVAAAAPGIFQCANKPGVAVVVNYSAGGKISCNDDYTPPGPGDVVSFYATGEGAVTPAIADGQAPAGVYPAPGAWSAAFGGVTAQMCASTFIGLVYAGVTQVNVCVPEGAPRTASVPLTLTVGGAQSPPAATDLSPGWKLIWSDEFNGAAGSPPDGSKWAFDLGGGGWGNQELETYTNNAANIFQDGAGNLTVRAVRGPDGQYTSARMKTQGKFEFQYGKAEARIRIPSGQGLWPAFWMLGADIATANWPACGEIDIMENIGREPATVHATVHGPGYSGGGGIGGPANLAAGRFADDYHVYGVEWSAKTVAFYLDGAKYFEVTPAKLPTGAKWVYDHPFFLLLNVAVGGQWPGNPDATTVFPQQMLVDWVRVYQQR